MKKVRTNRASKGTMEERISTIALELLDGRTRKDLLRYREVWGVEVRQIEEYMHRAWEGIREINKIDQEETLATVHANLWDLFRQAKEAGDLKECHAVLNSIAKLKGLHEVKITKTIISKFDGVSDEDLDAILDEEFGRH